MNLSVLDDRPPTSLHALRAARAVVGREVAKFLRQPARLASALVRPLLWLLVFSAGFHNVFGVAIIPPYDTYVEYKTYMVPGLMGMIALFNGMQSSLSMVYDREMGVMRLLLTAPLSRALLLGFKLLAGTALSVLQMLVFLLVAWCFGVSFEPLQWLAVMVVMVPAAALLASLGLLLSVYVRQLENFAGTMNFVIFPMFFISTALYPLWKLQESGADVLYRLAQVNPFTHAVELVRFALYERFNLLALAVCLGLTLAFSLLAVLTFNPQHAALRKST